MEGHKVCYLDLFMVNYFWPRLPLVQFHFDIQQFVRLWFCLTGLQRKWREWAEREKEIYMMFVKQWFRFQVDALGSERFAWCLSTNGLDFRLML
uniref:Uncharacterized protein n=1 Tax=Oryza brachyantha TaxID=4533 RepID=J3LI73_ORYBR